MKIFTYDCEVTAYDYLVVFKDKETGEYTCFHNEGEQVRDFITDDAIYVGFNSKHYDQYIIKAIVSDYAPERVKEVNDYIIGGGQGWECPLLQGIWFQFNNVDIRDDMQKGLSLKAIEGHLGMDIRESTVPFDIDRSLTDEELNEMIFYCKHDVDATEMLIDVRKDYLKNKAHIGKLAGIDEIKAMSMTNAKLTAALLKAERKEWHDERDYQYPKNLERYFIPSDVIGFFDRMKDSTIPNKDLFSEKIELFIGECPITIGYGGIHGAIPNYMWEQHDSRIIRNFDVASYYPHLMTLCGYTSRNMPDASIFSNVLNTRMQAKASGDKATANALKLVVNTTYGAMLNQYNDLCDPLMGRSVCISGQLYLLELAERLYQKVPNLKIVQLNTDGIMVEFNDDDLWLVHMYTDEWQKRTGFELEEDSIQKIAQKDVNNYCEIQSDSSVKCKGGYLVKGIAPAGAFNVNNSCVIVAMALKEYFTNGTPVKETIENCNDISQFQIIAKAGAKYREAYHIVDGEKQPVQKVNRVYASKDARYGKLYKVKDEDNSEAKIESLPEHCIIDNDNHLMIEDVDKTFYIDMAQKRVNDFLGIKPEKKTRRKKAMAAATSKNVYQKLLEARARFLEEGVQKSGMNMHLSFDYFELKDIVPVVTKIFKEIGLIAINDFTEDNARLIIVNVDKPGDAAETIIFSAPFHQIKPIISNTGKQATNEMQALGSSITYMRRYLYMIAMDICEADEIEANIGKPESPAKKETVTAPATPQQRQTAKVNLTNKKGKADDLQITGLKTNLKKLREKDAKYDDFVAEVAVKTKGFTEITKEQCEALMIEINKKMEE